MARRKPGECMSFWVGSPPADLRLKITSRENEIAQCLQIMAHRRIAMQIKTAGRFENTVKFQKSQCHHHQIREGVRRDLLIDSEQVVNILRLHCFQFLERLLHVLQRPGILECDPLCLDFLVVEEHIIVTLAVERRIDVDEIDRFIRNAFTENVKTIAEI